MIEKILDLIVKGWSIITPIYVIDAYQGAAVLRLGKLYKTVEPGIHFKWPFVETFIEEMIIHHQGAIDMAESAKKNAGHDEIKSMATDIISAQTKEIDQMRQWQKDWSY